MEELTSNTILQQKKNRVQLILIAMIFMLPLAGAWLLFFIMEPEQLWGTSNHGTLIVPARPLESFTVQRSDSTFTKLQDIQGKWTLVYFSPLNCDIDCRDKIDYLRRAHMALGKDIQRVQRFIVLSDNNQYNELKNLSQIYPDLQIAYQDDKTRGELNRQFKLHEYDKLGNLYLIDPLGNIMMFYPDSVAPRGILEDLRKLLKISQIG